MPDFAPFDRRHYPTASVRDGYGEWSATYERSVEDGMDLALLDRIETVRWRGVERVADLGCGSGRTAAWLTSVGTPTIDGIDLTPEMLDLARVKGHHRQLVQGDVRTTPFEGNAYDVVVCCLVDEHLPELTALYREARRLLRRPGSFVVVGFHPYFIMSSGMPTHFDSAAGEAIAIETHVHLPSEHMAAARAAAFSAAEFHEALIDDDWVRAKPTWERFRGWPVSFAWVWTAT